MSRRGSGAALAAIAAVALVLPAAASAHAVLLHTVPDAGAILDQQPEQVALTYSEAVEPRFAIVSITDAAGHRVSAGSPQRAPADPDTLVVPLRRLGEGWYLVYWRVISVDGHPVRGAFTFAVGPNPGPAPEFAIPSISETAATPRLIVSRWVVFLSAMIAIGLFVLRMLIARPLVRRVRETRLRGLSIAFLASLVVALVATPVYVVLATAQFALRSPLDLGSLVPLLSVSAFGRGYLELELCLALFAVAGSAALWLDRPQRELRSIAELLSLAGGLAAAGAVVLVPSIVGHAGQTSPRGAAVLFDWAHVAAGSVWIGGLVGLLVLFARVPPPRRIAALVVCVPRFSNVALVSVLVLVAGGTGSSLLHLPTLGSLWQTNYGKAILVKIGLLLAAALLAAVNLLRSKPRLAAAARRAEAGEPAARLLRRLVGGEAVLVAGAILTAAVLSSLAPPAKALAEVGKAAAHVGPGAAHTVVHRNGYTLDFGLDPNRAAVPGRFGVRIARDGKPLRGADVTLSFAMLDMEMGQQQYRLPETEPGVYSRSTSALVMVGHWGLSFDVAPPTGAPFTVLLVDHATG